MVLDNKDKAVVAETLDHVLQLNQRMTDWTNQIDAIAQQTTTSIKTETDKLLAAAEAFQQLIKDNQDQADQAAATATEKVKTSIDETVAQAAEKSINQVIGKEVQMVIKMLIDAARGMKEDTAQATQNVQAATKTVNWKIAHRAVISFGLGAWGAITVVILYEVAKRS